MSTVQFDRAKKISAKFKHIVFGFTRNCQKLLPKDSTYFHIHESIQLIILLFFYHQIESNILTDNECDDLSMKFEKRNNSTFEYDLVYSIQRDERKGELVSSHYQLLPNLLCIIETDDGNVFGGYTSTGWGKYDSSKGIAHGKDDPKAFLFSVPREIKEQNGIKIFNVINKEGRNALLLQEEFVCMFGLNDLWLYDDLQSGETCCLDTYTFQAYPDRDYLPSDRPEDIAFNVNNFDIFQLKQLQ